ADSYAKRRPLLLVGEEENRLADRVAGHFEAALLASQRGLEEHPDSSDLRKILTDLVWERLLEVEKETRPPEEERLRGLLLSYAPEVASRLQPKGRVSVESDPPGATVYFYRYVPSGALLLPVPYVPGRGLSLKMEELPPPQMRVVRPPAPGLAQLGIRQGDRILEVAGVPVDFGGNRALRRLRGTDSSAALVLERAGHRLEIGLPSQIPEGETWRPLNECVESDAFPLSNRPGTESGRTPLGKQ